MGEGAARDSSHAGGARAEGHLVRPARTPDRLQGADARSASLGREGWVLCDPHAHPVRQPRSPRWHRDRRPEDVAPERPVPDGAVAVLRR